MNINVPNMNETGQQQPVYTLDTARHESTNTTTDETVDIPSFKTDEGRFLAKSLGEPLMKGLTEVANVKPKDPIAYLASYLSNFPEGEKLQLKSQENQESAPNTSNVGNNVFGNLNETNSEAVYPIGSSSNRRIEAVDVENITPESAGTPDGPESALSSEIRDEHGQSMLHFAAARSHSRRNALLQMLQESNINIGYRDELYRTARDVTLQANALQNTSEIDNYVLQLAATGKADKIMELLLEGYDHILDVTDDDGKSITDVIMQRGLTEIKDLLNSIPPFESTREELHQAIRMGLLDKVKATLLSPERGRMLAIAKNINGRTSLHIAVLVENEEIVEYLAWSFPELLRIGDNLERTALHYAMGMDKIEVLSRILIKAGARRVLKDLKGRQATYYFMNKSDILRLKEEEEEKIGGVMNTNDYTEIES